MTPTTRALAYRVGDLIRDAATRHGAIIDASLEGETAGDLVADAAWLAGLAASLYEAACQFEQALREDSATGPHVESAANVPHFLDCAPFEGSTVEPLDAVLAEEIDSPYFWPPPAGGGR